MEEHALRAEYARAVKALAVTAKAIADADKAAEHAAAARADLAGVHARISVLLAG